MLEIRLKNLKFRRFLPVLKKQAENRQKTDEKTEKTGRKSVILQCA